MEQPPETTWIPVNTEQREKHRLPCQDISSMAERTDKGGIQTAKGGIQTEWGGIQTDWKSVPTDRWDLSTNRGGL